MPAGITHRIFAEETKLGLTEETKNSLPNYDKYLISAQGYDGFIYPDFKHPWRIAENRRLSNICHHQKFQEQIYNYLDIARQTGVIEKEQTRLLLYGIIGHHILDSHAHPFINYNAGDLEPDRSKSTWDHGNIEAKLDAYIYLLKRKGHLADTNVIQDFALTETFDIDVKEVVNKMIVKTFHSTQSISKIENAGDRLISVYEQYAQFMKIFRNDPDGRKKKKYQWLEDKFKFALGATSFSNHVRAEDAEPYLNLDHQEWLNPTDGSKVSTESYIDLYDKALEQNIKIINMIDKLTRSNFNSDDIYSIVPDVSALSGLSGEIPFSLENTKKKRLTKKK